MTDQELADKIVALGVATTKVDLDDRDWYWHDGYRMPTKHFVRDWRVAGTLMDRLPHTIKISAVDNAAWVEITIYSPNGDEEADPVRIISHQENQPRAIIEACVEALGD